MDIAKSSQIIKSKDVNMLKAPDNEKVKESETVNSVRHLAVVNSRIKTARIYDVKI